MLGKISLNSMSFHAFHGCYEEEKLHGNSFLVHIEFWYNISEAAKTDDLNTSIDYTLIYARVAEIMQIPVQLLEHLAANVLADLKSNFQEVEHWKIKIEKCNPPINGKVASISIELEG